MLFFQSVFCLNELKWIKIFNSFQSIFVYWVVTRCYRDLLSGYSFLWAWWSQTGPFAKVTVFKRTAADGMQNTESKRLTVNFIYIYISAGEEEHTCRTRVRQKSSRNLRANKERR